MSRLQTVTLAAHGLSISIRVPPEQMQFPQSPQNIPVSRTMFASGSQTRRPPPATGWELQVAKFSKFSQPGPGSGPGHAGPGSAWLPGVLAQAPGTCQGLWKVGHCTLYTGALYTVQATPVLYTESLHICICNLLNQIVEKIFTATALIVS